MCAKVRISFSFTGQEARNVTLQFDVPEYIKIDRNPIVIDSLQGGGTPRFEDVFFYGKVGFLTGSMEVLVNACYFNQVSNSKFYQNSLQYYRICFQGSVDSF